MMDIDLYKSKIATSIMLFENSILGVKNLDFVKMLDYTKANHKKVSNLVKEGRVNEVEQLSESEDAVKGEDLMIMRFLDNQDKQYIALVYDSDELWQDPNVLEILSI